MKREDFKITHNLTDNLDKEIENFILKHNLLKNNIRKYIRYYNQLRIQILKLIIKNKIYYTRNISYWKSRITRYRIRKNNYTILLGTLIEEFKNIPKPKKDEKHLNQIRFLKKRIEKIDSDTNRLEKMIKSTPLDIKQENEIINKINTLKKEKNKLTKIINEKDLTQRILFENNKYYITLKKIEFIRTYLDYIQIQLIKWRDKRKKIHLEILHLYRKINDISNNKKNLDNQFKGIIFSNENIKQYITEFLNNEKISLKEESLLSNKSYHANNLINEKKKDNWHILQRHKHKKLAIAVEKKRKGKKLDFYELKLILENSKKK